MTLNDLSDAELDAAIEALDAWAGLPPPLPWPFYAYGPPGRPVPEDLSAKIEAGMNAHRAKVLDEVRQRRELSVLIQSKLIQIKQARQVERLVRDNRGSQDGVPGKPPEA